MAILEFDKAVEDSDRRWPTPTAIIRHKGLCI